MPSAWWRANSGRHGAARRVVSPDATSATVADLQNRLQQHLGTRVIFHHGEKRGRIEIEYYGNDDLQRVLNAIGFPAGEG